MSFDLQKSIASHLCDLEDDGFQPHPKQGKFQSATWYDPGKIFPNLGCCSSHGFSTFWKGKLLQKDLHHHSNLDACRQSEKRTSLPIEVASCQRWAAIPVAPLRIPQEGGPKILVILRWDTVKARGQGRGNLLTCLLAYSTC